MLHAGEPKGYSALEYESSKLCGWLGFGGSPNSLLDLDLGCARTCYILGVEGPKKMLHLVEYSSHWVKCFLMWIERSLII